MTENKRFTKCDDGTFCLLDNGKGLEYDEVIDLFNELYEQNQNLKFLNNKYAKENKSLRVIRNSLKGIKKHIDLLLDDGVIE